MQRASNFDLSARPRRAFNVRKRRQGAETFLISKVDIFRLDPLGEAVWARCDGETTVTEMVARLAPLFPQEEFVTLMQAVARSILFLAQRNLIEPLGPPPPFPPALERAPLDESLTGLMQAFHRDPEAAWDEGLARETAEKVQTRFFRICYEAYWSAAEDKRHAMNEQTFRTRWRERFIVNREAAASAFAEKFGLKSWRFNPAQNKIFMSLKGSVYEGDVDHRR